MPAISHSTPVVSTPPPHAQLTWLCRSWFPVTAALAENTAEGTEVIEWGGDYVVIRATKRAAEEWADDHLLLNPDPWPDPSR